MGKERDQRYEVGFSLGGYILKDRLWFFGSVLPVFRNITRPVVFPGETDADEYTRKWKYYNFQGKITAQPFGSLRLQASFVNNFSKYKGDLELGEAKPQIIQLLVLAIPTGLLPHPLM